MKISKKGRWLYVGRVRISFEMNWRSRPYPWWFNAKYSDGMQRTCVPFLTMDGLPYSYFERNRS